jgi:hypothetical protein
MRVNISDFEVKDIIGRGHFGEVHVSSMYLFSFSITVICKELNFVFRLSIR